jgi:hypothetical protein
MSDDAQYIDPELLDDIEEPTPARKRTLLEWTFVHSRAIALGMGAVLLAGVAYAVGTIQTHKPQPVQVIDSSAKGTLPGVPNVGTQNPVPAIGRGEALLDASVTTGNPAEAARQLAATIKASTGKTYRVSVMVWADE